MQDAGIILVVEVRPEDARTLSLCLAALEAEFRLAVSVEQAIQLLQRAIFREAIVAAELNVGQDPMIAYLSDLPATDLIVATGPPGDWEMERSARFAGADFYLPRPVSVNSLAQTLRKPALTEIGSEPQAQTGLDTKARTFMETK